MGQYILQRLLMLIPVLVGVSLLTFIIARATPGDPVALMLGQDATPQRIAQLREQLGLDDPLVVQYGRFLWNAVRGDLGLTIRGQRPVIQEIMVRAPSTLQLTLVAMLVAVVLGISAGAIAATARGRWLDRLTMLFAMVGLCIPGFWLGIIFVIVFGVQLRWVSVTGGEGLKDLILPALALGLGPAAVLARLSRSSMLEVFGDDYVRTARAKGLHESVVVLRHVLRNALIPVVTVMGLQFAGLMGGTVFIEAVFGRPGLGRLAVNAVAARDYPMVQGIVLLAAVVYVVVNLVVDLLYAFLDPRIRYD